jgi:hypothetical protein
MRQKMAIHLGNTPRHFFPLTLAFFEHLFSNVSSNLFRHFFFHFFLIFSKVHLSFFFLIFKEGSSCLLARWTPGLLLRATPLRQS